MSSINYLYQASSLEELMQKNFKAISTLHFSTFVFNAHERMNPVLLSREVLNVYKELEQRIQARIQPHSISDLPFVHNGLSRIPDPTKQNVMNLTASAIYQLRNLIESYSMDMPDWLPEVFKTESIDGKHAFSFLFNWSTVRPSFIGYNDISNFMSIIDSYSKSGSSPTIPKKSTLSAAATLTASEQSLINKQNEEQHKPQMLNIVKPVSNTPERRSVPYTAQDDSYVQHNLYVAKKYLKLYQSAVNRGLQFNLTLDDMDTLLRTNRCFYSNVELTAFPHEENEELPGNYLTIDRVDNALGYVRGNVVVCAQQVNQLKDQMSADDFRTAMSIKQVMSTLTEQQRALLTAN